MTSVTSVIFANVSSAYLDSEFSLCRDILKFRYCIFLILIGVVSCFS